MGHLAERKRHAAKVLVFLRRYYPEARCALEFRTPLDLLVATLLSAQCTDKRVNQVTRELFHKYRTAADYAQADLAELEREIQSTGFYHNKAKNLKACCQALVAHYGGQVPREMDALVALPGIGRKTANVVLGTAFGIPAGIVVDTHVGRVSHRLGLTDRNPKDAAGIEEDLMAVIPKNQWIDFSHQMIQHGRQYCTAQRPKCSSCPLSEVCPKIGIPKNKP